MKLPLLAAVSLITTLAACGGGGSSTSPSLSIVGVAATGAAISMGKVEAKCATGEGTAITNADGTYTVSVPAGAQPCILKATDPVSKIELHSVVELGATKANITPVTNLVVANALGDDPRTAFANFGAAAKEKITSANIATAVTRVEALTAALGADANMTGIDFMKGYMQAATANTAGDATDKKIDALMAALAAADKKITDLTEQVRTLTDSTHAATTVTSVIGNAQHSLADCPYARNGDIWVLDLFGTVPTAWNVDFQNMRIRRNSDNSTYGISLKRDSSNKLIPCAFISSINGQTIEYRISTGGVGVWTNSSDFGITVPVQKPPALTDASIAGTYPAIGFVKRKTNSDRISLPIRFEIKTDGSIEVFSCDLTKSLPDCNTTETITDNSVTCTPISNGTLSCVSPGGIAATAVLYVTGNQITMFMAVTNMTVASLSYGGLIVMTKATELKLPAVGSKREAGAFWTAGVQSGDDAVIALASLELKVEYVDSAKSSFVVSYADSVLTTTNYIDVPAKGFVYTLSNGTKNVSMGTSSWALTMSKGPTSAYYDGWFAGVRIK